MRTQPALRALDLGVAVVALAFEGDVRRETVLVPLQREHARHFMRAAETPFNLIFEVRR